MATPRGAHDVIFDLEIEPASIPLRGGPTVAEDAVLLALDLADRGIDLRVDAGRLLASPRKGVTENDAAHIRGHRDDLVAIVQYVGRQP